MMTGALYFISWFGSHCVAMRGVMLLSPCSRAAAVYTAAFAVGKYGLILDVKDDFDHEEELAEQVKGLSGYFAKRELGNGNRHHICIKFLAR